MKPRKAFHRTKPIRIEWTGFRPMHDFWGNELKRFYKLETLSSATEIMLRGKDRFIRAGIQSVLGPAEVTSLAFDLFQEGRYQLIFRLRAANARARRANFGFVVAKNEKECSAVAQAEHRHLRTLFQRAPQHVVKPFLGGTIYLPDRHRRPEFGRDIYAYLTEWLGNYDELGVDRNLQFFANVPKRHTFTIAETELLKGQMAEIIFRTYDPKNRAGMALPEIASGDFVVRHGPKTPPRLKLIACRNLITRLSPTKLLDQLLDASWDWGGRRLYLAPVEPQTLWNALARAVGSDTAREWVNRYTEAVAAGKYPARNAHYLEELAGIASIREKS